MTSKTAAVRYARALFDVALTEKVNLETIDEQLSFVQNLLVEHGALGKAMLNPAVPVPRKRAAMAAITAQAKTLPVVSKLLLLLAERDRLALLPDLVAAYRDRVLDYQNIVRAEVTTAVPLANDRAKAIEQSLAKATGRTVLLSTRVDPSIVGGVVTRIGSTIYDGSITRQLQKMKQRLNESV